MKKLILCASLSCMAMMYSCQRDELVPADEKLARFYDIR